MTKERDYFNDFLLKATLKLKFAPPTTSTMFRSEMTSMNKFHEGLQTQRKLVEQLRGEASVSRLPVSECLAEMVKFIEQVRAQSRGEVKVSDGVKVMEQLRFEASVSRLPLSDSDIEGHRAGACEVGRKWISAGGGVKSIRATPEHGRPGTLMVNRKHVCNSAF